jgi:multiple sugar transport system ATP-binding protein
MLPDGPLTLGMRPEDVAVTLEPTDGSFAATVFVSEPLGNEVIVNVNVGPALIKVRAPPSVRPVRGQTVYLCADSERLHLFGVDGRRLNG